MPTPLRIVFMGSPEAALPCLEYLHQSVHKIVGVVAQPDRPSGRGRQSQPCTVAAQALAWDLPLFRPESLKEPPFIETLKELQPDLIVVVAYGKILAKNILELPRFKCWNVHFSLLPKYRGAAPYQWALINGETETGISIIRLVPKLDAGPILSQQVVSIDPTETAGDLLAKLAPIGAQLLRETLFSLQAGELNESPQDDSQATFAPQLKKADGLIDWELSATELSHRIRGLSPWPGAYTFVPSGQIDKVRLKIYSAQALKIEDVAIPGTVLQANNDGFIIACGEDALKIEDVQLEGKKRMNSADMLRGTPIPEESQL